MNDSIVTGIQAVAEHFGKSERQVRRWIRAGMPRLSGKRFDLLQVQAWLDRKQGIGVSDSAETPGLRGERQRERKLTFADHRGKDFWDGQAKQYQAKLRELEYRQRQGELVELQEVEAMFVARIMAVKQGLLALSRVLPPQLSHCRDERDMEIFIARAVRSLLEVFSRPLQVGRKEMVPPLSAGIESLEVAEVAGDTNHS